jgi:hypothetical protein
MEVVLESAYVPIMRVETGASLWNSGQLRSLFVHRFGLLFGNGQAVDAWDFRSDHRFGDRSAMAFALPRAVRVLLDELGRERTIRLSAWRPALVWGLRHFPPTAPSACSKRWWAWGEQDRTMLLGFEGDDVCGFIPALPGEADDEERVRACAGAIGLDALSVGSAVDLHSFERHAAAESRADALAAPTARG